MPGAWQTELMRLLLSLLLGAACLMGQIPAQDLRNVDIPSTDTHFWMRLYNQRLEWEKQAHHLRLQILGAAGLLPMPAKSPLHPQIFGRIERPGYSIEKVLIETLPGYYLGGNLYRPAGRQGKFPGVLAPHGHWSRGRLENTELCSVPGRAINLARQGYAVFTYDMVGYNDTRQTSHGFGGKTEELWRFLPLGLQLWNSIRALDFISSLPDVDSTRLGATGASGGGTQTFLLTAVDDRVAVSAPVNMISAIMQGGDPCENAPGLRIGTFNVEIGAMMAPKPLLMVSATGDWTRHTPREEYPEIRTIYDLYNQQANLEAVQFDYPHNYNRASREAVYRFFAKHLKGDSNTAAYAEKPFQVEKDEDLLALHDHPLPSNALTFDQIFAQWRATSTRQMKAVAGIAELRRAFSYGIGVAWPGKLWSEIQGEHILISRAGHGDRIPGLFVPGKGAPVLIVDPKGSPAARAEEATHRYIRSGRPVLMIDAFQTGAAEAPRDRSKKYFLTFNLSDDTNRVQDVITAIAFLARRYGRSVEIVGSGDAALWCLFGAAAAEAPVKVVNNPSDFNGSDQDYISRFFVPGIQRAGGLATARRLTGLRP